MRAIERTMLDAIDQKKSWMLDNTQVYVDLNGDVIVKLFGNVIATITDDMLTVTDASWRSTTTKSRLNAILNHFNINAIIYQRKHQWHIGDSVWSGTHHFPLYAAVMGGSEQPGAFDAILGGQ